MHIPDGFLDPKLQAGLAAAAVSAVSYAIGKIKDIIAEPLRERVLAGVGQTIHGISNKAGEAYLIKLSFVVSIVFIAQMVDFKIAENMSGHFIFGALAAILLGPAGGLLSMSAVLLTQAAFLKDGGLFALGANIINMAFAGSFVAYYIYDFLKKKINEEASIVIAAWLSVVLAAFIFSLEMGGFLILKSHLIIGLAEAFVTLGIIKIFKALKCNLQY